MKPKPFAHSKQAGGLAKSGLARTQAYQRLFSGNGTKEDAEIVLAHLAHVTGYYQRPTYSDWLAQGRSPETFTLHSAFSNTKAEVVQIILNHVMMDDERLVALERAARLEAQQ